jgi:hypothetical protein
MEEKEVEKILSICLLTLPVGMYKFNLNGFEYDA